MATIDNAAVVREAYDAFNAKALDRLAALAVPGTQMTNVPFGAVLGFREYYQLWATAFPDGQIEVVNLVSQGDRVMVEFIGRGTQTGVLEGPMGRIPPTGKRVELRFVESLELRDGKIAGGRLYFDGAGFMSQLGIGPQMPQMAARQPPAQQPRH